MPATAYPRIENERILDSEGVREVELQVGSSHARQKGVAHNGIHVNEFEFCLVEV